MPFHLKLLEKKDTEIDCYDKSAIVNEEIELEAFLKEAGVLGGGLTDALVKFYIDDVYVDEDYTNDGDAPFPHTHGMARVKYKPTATGTFTIKAVFEAAGNYNGSEDTGTLTVTTCDKGMKVTVKDCISGLKLQYVVVTSPPIGWEMASEKTIPASGVVIISDLGAGLTYRARVINAAGKVMSEKDDITIPSEGCASITLYGWLGRPYRSRIEVEPVSPKPGEMFTLKAILVENPDEPATKDLEVIFYKKKPDNTWEQIGSGKTDSGGIARFMTSEATKGTYTYKAEYNPLGESTYPEEKRVYVSSIPPCPLEALFTEWMGGTIVFSVFPSIRLFRDNVLATNVLGRQFIKFYYGKFKDWTVPLIVKSNIVRAIGIALVTPLILLIKTAMVR